MTLYWLRLLLAVNLLITGSNALASVISRTGALEDLQAPTQPSVCLAGGGDDNEWANGWRYLLSLANGGDVVVIRADGRRGGYEDWIYFDPDQNNFPKLNSVTTLQLEYLNDGNQDDVISAVENAEMIFFAGGDQNEYIRLIKGTRLHAALDKALHVRKIPIGGTSAGMAILGSFDFTARYPSPSGGNELVSSEDVLADPTAQFVDLELNFLKPNFLEQVVTDTHFSQRNRQGRLVGFMAKAVYNQFEGTTAMTVKGIGVDEGTSVCINSSGKATIFGRHNAYFIKGQKEIEQIKPSLPLLWDGGGQALSVYVINGKSANTAGFDLGTWVGFGGVAEYWSIDGTGFEIIKK